MRGRPFASRGNALGNSISVEYLKTLAHFITASFTNICEEAICVLRKPLPKKPLITNIKTELSYVIDSICYFHQMFGR